MSNKIFKIRKQTFHRNISRYGDEWTVNIAAHDEHSDDYHVWKIKCDYNTPSGLFYVDGSSMDENARYDRPYCELVIFDYGQSLLTIRKEFNNEPKFNAFSISFLHSQELKPVQNESERHLYRYPEFQIYITVTTSEDSKFFEGQKTLLDEGTLTDTIIKTKEKEFPCHKFVLASQSEYFKKMFQTDMMESRTNTVNWTGVYDAPVVKDLLHFLYTGQTPPNIKDNHFGLLEVAQCCHLPILKGMCVESIVSEISTENAAYVLQLAVMYESNCLKSAALAYVVDHREAILPFRFLPAISAIHFQDIIKKYLPNV